MSKNSTLVFVPFIDLSTISIASISSMSKPTPEDTDRLRGLYAALLESGRPVQVRTFHSWFAALLRNAPWAVLDKLGLPSRYELLENDRDAVEMVWRRFHTTVAAHPAARADFEASIATHGRFNTQKALTAALAKRVEFTLADEHDVVEGSVKHFSVQFPGFDGMLSVISAWTSSETPWVVHSSRSMYRPKIVSS